MKTIRDIESKINQLSPGLIRELDNYLNYLIDKRGVRRPKKLKQDWAGALKDVNIKSIELQKKALDWRHM